jgi:membrane-bound lytic murein transglycosylase D
MKKIAARRLVLPGILLSIVALSSGCGLQPAKPGIPDWEGDGWGFGQVTSGDGESVTDSGAGNLVHGSKGFWRKGTGQGPAHYKGNDLWARLRAGFSMPSPDHPAVTAEVDWFARNQAFIDRSVDRGRPYLHHIVEEVESRGMPSELALLPVVESAFQPFAYSPARASGIWQFIPQTGSRFGLRQTWWYDGRRDVIASTGAALDYLTELNRQFNGDWLLAVAAYNCGEGTVARAIQQNERQGRPTDFWNLRLPEETRGYVPRLLALVRVVSDPSRHGLRLAAIPNKPYITRVPIDGPMDLDVAADTAGLRLAELRHLNPGFSRWATAPDGPHELVLPLDAAKGFQTRVAALSPEERMPWRHHVVGRGETLTMVARRYGTTPEALREVNDLSGRRVPSGTTLRIPVSTRAAEDATVLVADAGGPGDSGAPTVSRVAADKPAATRVAVVARATPTEPAEKASERSGRSQPAREAPARAATTIYTVKAGDTLFAVARRHGVSPKDLARWNELPANASVKTGQRLKVEGGAEPIVIAAAPAPRTERARPAGAKPEPARASGKTRTVAAEPRPIRYTVKAGESLWGISQRFGVSVALLRRWNNLGAKEGVRTGQELRVYREDNRLARTG